MSDKPWEYDILVKLLVVGDSATGKSCMLLRYSDDTFQETHMTTIGVDFKLKTKTMENNKVCKIQIWDTAGQERFRTITASYYRGAHGIILVFDLTNEKSFDHVSNWLLEIKENAIEDVSIILVGNKSDLVKERQVSKEKAQEFAKKHNMEYVETSAKNGDNIHTCFNKIIDKVIDKQNYLSPSKTSTVEGPKVGLGKGKTEEPVSSGCCG